MKATVPILKIGSTLIASLQLELTDSVVASFQRDLLLSIERTGAKGLIIAPLQTFLVS